MARSDLSDLVGGASEDLGVEYKAWIDTSIPETRAKLARHIAALANHGGGYLIFGVDDKTRRPLGANPFDAKLFSQEAMAGIVKKYLDPRVQLQVEDAELDGVSYPVLIVPSHGPRPVIAGADGPRTGNAPAVGVRQGEIYIRVAGPASEAIRSPDDWSGLLDRCLSHRSDLLGKILRQSIAKPSRPSSEASKLLLAAVEDTARDFASRPRGLPRRSPLRKGAYPGGSGQVLRVWLRASRRGRRACRGGESEGIERPRLGGDASLRLRRLVVVPSVVLSRAGAADTDRRVARL